MKSFTNFLTETYDIERGQAMTAHDSLSHSSSNSLYNNRVRAEINRKLDIILDKDNRSVPNNNILSPEIGFERIRKVLHTHGIDLPAILNLDGEEGEEIFQVNQFGTPYGPLPSGEYGEAPSPFYLYVYYFLNDQGYYEFFAEVVNEEELQGYLDTEGSDETED